jgi:hypothetical protein
MTPTLKKYSISAYYAFLLVIALSFSANLSAQETDEKVLEFLPDIDGILKTKAEYDLENSKVRFAVRNARFRARGKINNYMSYRAEVDLSDEGNIKMLDAYVRFTPIINLDFYMGQRKIPFSTDYIRSPADNIFANRSFLAKNINDGMRDIGFYTEYKLTGSLPVSILLGAVNGTGNNNPQWIDLPNFVSRIIAGPLEGLRIAGNLYYGEALYRDNLAMFGGEVRYSSGSFFIESEYICRNWTDTISSRLHDDGLYIHSYYNFNLENSMIHMITPVARIDFMGDAIFRKETDAGRVTLGINFGFEPKQFQSEIRLNYENYLKSSLPIHTDKVTLEFIARF